MSDKAPFATIPPLTDEDRERLKEQLLSAYLSEASGREKLVQATLRPCEELLLHAKEHPGVFSGDPEFGVKVESMVKVVDRLTAAMDGSEKYPKREFERMVEDLKALQSALPSDPL